MDMVAETNKILGDVLGDTWDAVCDKCKKKFARYSLIRRIVLGSSRHLCDKCNTELNEIINQHDSAKERAIRGWFEG